ncbi:MAG: hypothetical protein D3911_03910 [Candidatus Electrothrix sp. AW3_4]|nr:hypothetical protein [Candidatus Electrothrix gigas]
MMAENREQRTEKKTKIYHAISLVIIGFGVGWLTGLSISPVVAALLSSIIGAVLVLAAVLSGFSYGDNASLIKNVSDISPVPFALLMVGIIAGTSSGIWVRTHNVLGVISVEKQDNSFTKLQEELTQLKEQEGEGGEKGKWEGLDILLSDIAQRIIDKYYPKGGAAVNKSKAASSSEKTSKKDGITRESVLFSAGNTAKPCETLQVIIETYPERNLRSQIEESSIFFERISKNINRDSELEEVVKIICESSAEEKQ